MHEQSVHHWLLRSYTAEVKVHVVEAIMGVAHSTAVQIPKPEP